MIINRRRFLQLGSSSAAISLIPSAFAQNTATAADNRRAPARVPGRHATLALTNLVTGKAVQLKDGATHRAACLAEMERLNIVKKRCQRRRRHSPRGRHVRARSRSTQDHLRGWCARL